MTTSPASCPSLETGIAAALQDFSFWGNNRKDSYGLEDSLLVSEGGNSPSKWKSRTSRRNRPIKLSGDRRGTSLAIAWERAKMRPCGHSAKRGLSGNLRR